MPNPLQNLHFRKLSDFMEFLPEQELRIFLFLRDMILDALPAAEEKLAYNVPFYYQHYRVCYLWPASIPWGGKKREGVTLGFCQGHLLSDPEAYLQGQELKEIRSKTFQNIQEIETARVQRLLFEAAFLDLERKKSKSKWNLH